MTESLVITVDEHHAVQVLLNPQQPVTPPASGAVVSIQGGVISITSPQVNMKVELPAANAARNADKTTGAAASAEAKAPGQAQGAARQGENEANGTAPVTAGKPEDGLDDKSDLLERIEGLSQMTATQRAEVLEGLLAVLNQGKAPKETGPATRDTQWAGYSSGRPMTEQALPDMRPSMKRAVAAQ